jgi:hypothetical protein
MGCRSPRGDAVVGPYWLIAARERLHRETIKYFLSNASAGVPLEVLLHVGFSRWPVERCLEDEKSELGLSHFEVRKYDGVLRHLRITQVSHLFLARQTQRLAEKKSGGDDLPDEGRRQRVDRLAAAEQGKPKAAAGESGANPARDSTEERRREAVTRQNPEQAISKARHQPENNALLHPSSGRVAL